MKQYFPKIRVGACLASVIVFLSASVSYAQIDLDKPLYAGLALSRNHVALPVGKEIVGERTTYLSARDDSDLTWKLFVQMDYDERFDVQFAYHNIGSYQHRIRSIFADKQLEGIINTTLDYRALSLDLRPKYIFRDKYVVQGILGLAYISGERSPKVTIIGGQDPDVLVELQETINKTFKSDRENEISLLYGLSFSSRWREYYFWRFELNYSKHGDEDISMQQISLSRKIR